MPTDSLLATHNCLRLSRSGTDMQEIGLVAVIIDSRLTLLNLLFSVLNSPHNPLLLQNASSPT